MTDNNFFELDWDTSSGQWFVHDFHVDGGELDEWRLKTCQSVDYGSEIQAKVKYTGSQPDFFFAAGRTPVVSNRLAGVFLQLAPANVQLIPLKIDRASSNTWFVLNILSCVECINEERSITQINRDRPTPGQRYKRYKFISRIVINPEQIAGTNKIFRLKHWETVIVVSQDVKDAIESLKATGLAFSALSKQAPKS